MDLDTEPGAEPEPKPAAPAAIEPPTLEKSRVTKWLKENFAENFADKFFKEGYLEVAHVDNAAIDEFVPEKGTARRLKASIAPKEAMVPPDLPPKTVLNLSAPQHTVAGATFALPSTLSVQASEAAVQSPNALQMGDWMVIARNANLLYGFCMESPAPVRARRPVLEWVVPETLDFARAELLHARVESAVTYSEEAATYVKSGFDKETASAGYAFCSASMERQHTERTAKKSETKNTHATGLWKYPRATLFLDDCTRVSPAFVDAIVTALKSADPAAALRTVFEDYGHAVAMEVMLGGQLSFDDVRQDTGQKTEQQVEDEIKAGVKAKVQGFSGSAGAAVQIGTSKTDESVKSAQQTSFDVLGGDTTLASNPSAWASTVKDPQLWAAIGNRRVWASMDLLSDDLRGQVLKYREIPPEYQTPAIEEPRPEQLGSGAKATESGFLLGVRKVGATAGGRIFVASGRKDQVENDPVSMAGAADVQHNRDLGVHLMTNGVCLPVAGGADYAVWAIPDDKSGTLASFAATRFSFGRWQTFDLGVKSVPVDKKEDGFLCVSIDAHGTNSCGGVFAYVDSQSIAGASVHCGTRGDLTVERAAFCVPVGKGSVVTTQLEPHVVTAKVRAGWMPLGKGWEMKPSVPVEPNTRLKAETDGILHGFLQATKDGVGEVDLYSGAASEPWAATSVEYHGGRFYAVINSVMLPVGKGAEYIAKYTRNSAAVSLKLWFTPIVEMTDTASSGVAGHAG